MFTVAAWFAMVTGIAQIGVWIVARFVLRRALHFDPQIVWMTSAANLAVFGVIAALLVLGSRARTARAAIPIAVFATTSAYTIILMVPRLHGLAMLVLSIGLGVQAGRVLARRADPFARFTRRSLPVLAGVVALLTIGVNGVAWLREQRAADAVPPADGSPPNVLLLIWDTVRATHLGLYGYERDTTPFLEEFAARSIVFDRAIVNAPWTLASHGSLFTGRMPFELSASWEVPLDDTYPTIAGFLTSHGYATGAFVANYIYGPPAFGLGRGFVHYRFYYRTPEAILVSSPIGRQVVRRIRRWTGSNIVPGRRDAANITEAFLDWQAAQRERPFFAFLNVFDAHDPYDPAAPFDRKFGQPRVHRIATEDQPTPEMQRDFIDGYDGAIAWLDDRARFLLDELERRGVLDNTLVIIASDHGELFGEHRLYGHGNSLYIDELHVPLIVALPGRMHAGTRIEALVSMHELPATVADVLGFPETPFPGRSLARHWTGSRGEPDSGATAEAVFAVVPFAPRQPDWFPISAGDMRSVLLWPDQLIVRGDGREEMYDLAADPTQSNDLIDTADPARLERLRALIAPVPLHAVAPRD